MLMIVRKNPMQFTIVKAVPLISGSAFCATRVENIGESAITTVPQNNKKKRKLVEPNCVKAKGEIKQHIQES